MAENVRIDGLAEVRAALARAPRAAQRAAKLALNDTARKMRTAGSKAIRQQVNLKASYVNKHLRVSERARPKQLTAVISATKRPVLLSRYGAKQLTRKAKHPARSKGDPLRGISPGRKAAGVSVKVKAQRKKMRGAFLVPGLRGSGVMGVAIRTGAGPNAIKVLHGPSVDQVWRDVREDIAPEAEAHLSREYRRQLARKL